MDQAAKLEVGDDDGKDSAEGPLNVIYKALAQAKQSGESIYALKNEEDIYGYNVAETSGKTGLVSAVPHESDNIAARLQNIAIGRGSSQDPQKRTRREHIEALRQQGLQRQLRLKAQGVLEEEISDTKNLPRKKAKNVLTRMVDYTGPLQLLHRCVTEHLKVKVWTRSYKHVRGICTGYILAFDTHFNMESSLMISPVPAHSSMMKSHLGALVMEDVDEVYKPTLTNKPTANKCKRRKKKKVQQETTECSLQSGDRHQSSSKSIPVTNTSLSSASQVDGTCDSTDSESGSTEQNEDNPRLPGENADHTSESSGTEGADSKGVEKGDLSDEINSFDDDLVVSTTEESSEEDEEESDDSSISDHNEHLQHLVSVLGSLQAELHQLEELQQRQAEQQKDTVTKPDETAMFDSQENQDRKSQKREFSSQDNQEMDIPEETAVGNVDSERADGSGSVDRLEEALTSVTEEHQEQQQEMELPEETDTEKASPSATDGHESGNGLEKDLTVAAKSCKEQHQEIGIPGESGRRTGRNVRINDDGDDSRRTLEGEPVMATKDKEQDQQMEIPEEADSGKVPNNRTYSNSSGNGDEEDRAIQGHRDEHQDMDVDEETGRVLSPRTDNSCLGNEPEGDMNQILCQEDQLGVLTEISKHGGEVDMEAGLPSVEVKSQSTTEGICESKGKHPDIACIRGTKMESEPESITESVMIISNQDKTLSSAPAREIDREQISTVDEADEEKRLHARKESQSPEKREESENKEEQDEDKLVGRTQREGSLPVTDLRLILERKKKSKRQSGTKNRDKSAILQRRDRKTKDSEHCIKGDASSSDSSGQEEDLRKSRRHRREASHRTSKGDDKRERRKGPSDAGGERRQRDREEGRERKRRSKHEQHSPSSQHHQLETKRESSKQRDYSHRPGRDGSKQHDSCHRPGSDGSKHETERVPTSSSRRERGESMREREKRWGPFKEPEQESERNIEMHRSSRHDNREGCSGERKLCRESRDDREHRSKRNPTRTHTTESLQKPTSESCMMTSKERSQGDKEKSSKQRSVMYPDNQDKTRMASCQKDQSLSIESSSKHSSRQESGETSIHDRFSGDTVASIASSHEPYGAEGRTTTFKSPKSPFDRIRGTPLGETGLLQRHVSQVMIRGDNVIMVAVAQ